MSLLDDLTTWKFGDPNCARCGGRDAVVWMHSPRGGHVALCWKHAQALIAELRRHDRAMLTLLPQINS